MKTLLTFSSWLNHNPGRTISGAGRFALAAMLALAVARCLAAGEYYGISRPSSEASLSVTHAGRIISVRVVDGDYLQPGDPIAEQDGSVLDARMEQLRLEASSMVEIEASEAELAQREQDLKKIKQAHEKGAATDLELERAELEVVISRYRVKAAEEKRDMAGLKLKEAEAERKQYYLNSSVSGRVENLRLVEGESPRPNEPVMTLVNVDPLWIEVPLPLSEADTLSRDSEVTIRFPDGTTGKATVLFVSSLADPASETLPVRLTMPNPEKRRAGERVGIALPGRSSGAPGGKGREQQ